MDQLKHDPRERKHAMWPCRLLLLVNTGCVLGLASAGIAISNDNVVHDKVVAEIGGAWRHFFETETSVSALANTKTFAQVSPK